MSIIAGYMVPHPPIIVEEVGHAATPVRIWIVSRLRNTLIK